MSYPDSFDQIMNSVALDLMHSISLLEHSAINTYGDIGV